MEQLKRQASAAVEAGYTILILSDRGADRERAPIPSLLATAGVHHHLVRAGHAHALRPRASKPATRAKCITARCCSATAPARSNPYLAFETLDDMIRAGLLAGVDARGRGRELHQGAQQGHPEGDVQDGHLDAAELLRRADLRSRRPRRGVRRQILHVDGLAHRRRRHRRDRAGSGPPAISTRYPHRPSPSTELDEGGEYQWRRDGEVHLFNPDTVFKLQHATRSGQYTIFKEYTKLVDDQSKRLATLRGLLEFKPADDAGADRRSRTGRERSSSASPPARCRTDRSAGKRTRRSRSR